MNLSCTTWSHVCFIAHNSQPCSPSCVFFPKVLRVYVGSFWDEPLMYDDNAALFDMEERDLMNDLRELPRNSAVRKINELVKRCRLAKVFFAFGYTEGSLLCHNQMDLDLAMVSTTPSFRKRVPRALSRIVFVSIFSSLIHFGINIHTGDVHVRPMQRCISNSEYCCEGASLP